MYRILIFIITTLAAQHFHAQTITITSPDNQLSLIVSLNEESALTYSLFYKEKPVLKESKLGMIFQHSGELTDSFEIQNHTITSFDETWETVWGEQSSIRNHYNELSLNLRHQPTDINLDLTFRIFNDGLGFRYHFPKQPNLSYDKVTDELTEFHFTDDHTLFWIPGDYDTNEYPYNKTLISEINTEFANSVQEIGTRSVVGKTTVQTPVMLTSKDGLYINVHEAALIDFPAMYLDFKDNLPKAYSRLAQDKFGVNAYVQTPFSTPWRTILISDKAVDILASNIILNLNEPNAIDQTEWIQPQKYIGLWWELHVGLSSWNYADTSNIKLSTTNWNSLTPNGRHGATTERVKEYIDFAAQHKFTSVLVEGWNVGWEDWYGNWKEEVFDFVTPYPDFDIEELSIYATKKGVKLIMHHETSGSITNYERRIDSAFALMKHYGYQTVKTGYVGKIIPRSEYHDSQWSINHFNRVAELAAHHRIMINSHESARPTGLHRTWPNWLASEAARGNEFNAWSSGNPPDHETILPFTRLIGGPMDYTPGIFQIKMNYYNKEKTEQIHTTLAKQLALYVTIYSPLQMAADLPENYTRFADAFQFIKDVPVDWGKSIYLEAEPGDYLVVARKSKVGNEWFLGAVTDEQKRSFSINVDFLNPDIVYEMIEYKDAVDADWKSNPMAYKIEKKTIRSTGTITLILAPGGGTAISFKPISK